jgi:HD-GYP domain-containing protein (c-di-GMP phosphodiesterase class II)
MEERMETLQTAIPPQSGIKKPLGGAESDLSQLGNQLIQKFQALMKLSLIYDPKNEVLQPFLQECLHHLNALVEKEGTLSIKVVKDDLYLNELRVRCPVERYMAFKYVLTQWKKRMIGEIVFRSPMDAKALREFIFNLIHLEEGREENADLFTQQLTGSGIDSIEVSPLEIFEEERQGTPLAEKKAAGPKETAKKVFFEMIRMVREITPQIERQAPPNLRKFKRLVQKVIRLSAEDESTLLGLTTIKNYGGWTENHSVNVAIYSLAMGRRLGFSRNALTELATTALLHDIGKSKIPSEVLNKPSTLDDGEWSLMRQHPRAGVEVVLHLKQLAELNPRMVIGIFEHHLKNDLSGYPTLFRKKKVSLFGRLIHIADVYDAMTAPRIYRKIPYTPGQTVAIMVNDKGYHFDPILLKIFISIIGIYPIGSVVLLDTNDLGIVTKPNRDPGLIDRPTVLLVSEGVKGEVVDLSETDGSRHFKRSIAKTLDPFQNHIDIAKYFL